MSLENGAADSANGAPLSPALLVAVPQMADENFERSVVYLITHGAEGAFGLTLNRPASFDLGDICRELEIETPRLDPVWRGGPVDEHRGFLLHTLADMADSESVEPGVWLSGAPEVLEACCNREDPFRLFVGYAGWGPGQLEQELAAGAWLIFPAGSELVFSGEPDQLWARVLRRSGIDPATIVSGDGGLIN